MKIRSRILIVGESGAVRQHIEALLKKRGFHVVSVPDVHAGCRCLESEDFEVILLAGISSDERRLYSILLSASCADLRDMVSGLVSGEVDYIEKSFTESELIAKIKAALRIARLKKQMTKARHADGDFDRKLYMNIGEMLREEKLTTAAKLASETAHKMNTPLSYIHSNLVTLKRYSELLFGGLDRLARLQDASDSAGCDTRDIVKEIAGWIKKSKLQEIRNDIGPLITEVMEGIDDISFIIQSLLSFDRANSSSAVESTDVKKIVRFVFEYHRQKLSGRISFAMEADALPAIANCNAGQLHAAIEHIVKNSLEAIGEEGRVFMRVFTENSKIVIEIKDSGAGICPTYRDKVFEPFFTSKVSARNLGLGLTIAQFIVHAHNGSIEIQSSESEGATVIIRLPSAEPQITRPGINLDEVTL